MLGMPFAYGLTLEGGVTYTVESARKEAFEGVKYKIPVSSFKEHLTDKNFEKNRKTKTSGVVEFSDRRVGWFSDASYAVMYNKNKYIVYYYNKTGKLTEIDYKSSLVRPIKIYKYTPKGKLQNVIFDISANESFIYKLDGKLEAHWVGNNCYDEEGKLILKRL